MTTLSVAGRFGLVALLLAGTARGESVVRLSAVNPKAVYRPGETIALEMTCAPGMKGTAVIRLEAGALPPWEDGNVRNAVPKCPRARFEVQVPPDFVGRAKVSALLGGRVVGTFTFKAKSLMAPIDLHITSSGAQIDPDECSTIAFDPDHPGRVWVQFVAEQPDGTIFDLCRGADIRVTTDPSEWFRFKADGHACSITSRREGTFKLAASYGGLRKEFACRVQNFEGPSSVEPAASPVPLPKVSTPPAGQRAEESPRVDPETPRGSRFRISGRILTSSTVIRWTSAAAVSSSTGPRVIATSTVFAGPKRCLKTPTPPATTSTSSESA